MNFGMLTVDHYDPERKRWACRCECGNTTFVRGDHLKDAHVKSCGCASSQKSKERFTKHGMSRSRIYRIWTGMKQRCLNQNSESYADYGGRGITVCNEWANDFQVFYDWAVLNGYSDKLSIDRINPNGNYEPSNCRWATMREQERNKRTNRMVLDNGAEIVLKDYCEKYGLPYRMILKRLLRGWELSDAIMIPSLRATGGKAS